MDDDPDYAHLRDPQAQRTRFELWLIVAIVVVVICGALIWRAVSHQPPKPQKGWDDDRGQVYPAGTTPAAAAGVHSPAAPPPRPVGP